MLNLIKLEMKKMKIMSSIKGVAIAILIIGAFLTLVALTAIHSDAGAFKDFSQMLLVDDLFIRSTFIIYSSVILSKLIIDEFRNKTINLMFLYPIERKKILISKLIIVSLFTFVCTLVGNILIAIYMLVLNKYTNFTPGISTQVFINTIVPIFMNAMAAAGVCLIPLFFGMRKKSTSATVVSSVILMFIVCGNYGNSSGQFSLSNILPVTIGIGLIGVLIAYLTIKNIENVDIN